MHPFENSSRNRRRAADKAIGHVFRWSAVCFFLLLPLVAPVNSQAAQVTLQWDASADSNTAGYHLYCRASGKSYNYAAPAWQGSVAKCTIYGLAENTIYHFVVRAFDQAGNESGDSNEVLFDTNVPPPPGASDPAAGNGTSHRMNPFPTVNPKIVLPDPPDRDVPAPDRPESITPGKTMDPVSTEPSLITSEYSGPNGQDSHAYTRWQIFRAMDNLCVYDQTSAVNLTEMEVLPLVLDGGVEYYWTAMHFARSGAVSLPAQDSFFWTAEDGRDINANGISDSYELSTVTDLDHNGISDSIQSDLKCFWAAYGPQKIGVKLTTFGAADKIVAAQPVDPLDLESPSGLQPDMPDGLVNFKLRLGADSSSAVVAIYFSNPVASKLYWIVYDPVQGYMDYSEFTSISADRRTVTLLLEDGQPGDMDGVSNGVVVTMAGYSYGETTSAGIVDPSANASASSGSSRQPWDLGASCFIGSLLTD